MAVFNTGLTEMFRAGLDFLRSGERRHALVAYGLRIGNAGLLFLLHILLARWLGEFEFGVYVLVWTWLTILTLIAALGLGTGILRFVPQYRASGSIEMLRGLLMASRYLAVGAATVLGLASAALVWAFGDLNDNHYAIPFLVGLACLPLLALSSILDGIARSYDWIGLALAPDFLLRPVLLLVLMVGVLVAGGEANATSALYCVVAASWIAVVWQALVLQRRLRKEVPAGPRSFEVRTWLRISFPLLMVDSFYVLMVNTDVMVLSLFVGPAEVGLYFAAAKLLALVSMVLFAASVATGHRFAAFHAVGDVAGLSAFVRRVANMTLWPSLAVGASVLALGYPLLMLFGEGFTRAYPVLFLLAIGILARSSIGPADRLLSVTGQQDAVARIALMTLLTNICFNVILVPVFGIYGAAAATSIALIFECLFLNREVRRTLGVNAFALASIEAVPVPDTSRA